MQSINSKINNEPTIHYIHVFSYKIHRNWLIVITLGRMIKNFFHSNYPPHQQIYTKSSKINTARVATKGQRGGKLNSTVSPNVRPATRHATGAADAAAAAPPRNLLPQYLKCPLPNLRPSFPFAMGQGAWGDIWRDFCMQSRQINGPSLQMLATTFQHLVVRILLL